jgi:Domain of unknown function (DUF4349)
MSAPDNTILEQELAAIDDALASGRVAGGDGPERELQELALALRDDAPEPAEAFAETLAAHVRDGFPRERRRRLRLQVSRRRVMWAAGTAASLAVAVVVAVNLQSDPELQDLSGRGAAPEERPEGVPLERVSPTTGGGANARSLPAPAAQDFEPGGRGRAIERSAQLTLAASGGELDAVADRIVAVTDRHRGFVLRSSVTSGDDSTTGGSFELRIPADKLRSAIRDLSELGHVRSRTQAGDDVTRDVISVRERLSAARAERRSLLRRLENANTDDQAEAIRRRLDLVAGEIRALRGRSRDLRLRTDYATVSVSLVEDGANDSGAGGGTGEALDDALGSLTGAFNLTLRALGVLLPLALLGGAAWLVARTLRRRRREAALS